jgi:hypothetical protein
MLTDGEILARLGKKHFRLLQSLAVIPQRWKEIEDYLEQLQTDIEVKYEKKYSFRELVRLSADLQAMGLTCPGVYGTKICSQVTESGKEVKMRVFLLANKLPVPNKWMEYLRKSNTPNVKRERSPETLNDMTDERSGPMSTAFA